MGRGRRRANAPYPRAKICLSPFVDWMRSVLLATPVASVGKSFARAPSSARLTAESRLGSFGNRGNGQYRVELRQGLAAITRSLTAHHLEPSRTLLRLDGQYGTGAALSDLAGFAFITRGKDYRVLDHPLVQARLHLPKDSVKASSGKSDGAQPRPLPRSARGARRPALPRGRRNAIGPLKRRAWLVSRVQASSTNSS